MDITCSAEPCPIILNATCVFYEGNTLIYTGIVTNDNLQTALQKIDQKFQDAGLGYIFSNGIEQLAPGQPVMLGGSLNHDTNIGGLYNLAFAGTLEASALITTGGTSTDFVKGDGSLDPTNYQPAGNYISNLIGDVTANGPGSVVAILATVFGAPGTYGNSGNVPSITVDGKGRVTNVTNIPINYPSQSLSFVGDVTGSGFTGSPVTLTLDTVNTDIYGSNNFLKFAVNGKGLITSATPVNGGDITTALGYVPVNDAIELTINGIAHDLTANRSWSVGTVTGVSVTAGIGISASVSNPNTTPVINIVNTAPDQTVNLNAGFGISISGSYPNFTITNDYPDIPGSGVTSFSAGNLSPLFTTSVTNPTTTPALSFALANAAANTVLAGPNGGSGAPTYRALVAADIPSLSYISSISTTAPLATTGGLTPTLSISQAGSTTDGYLSSTDWNIFDNKTSCTGTVTSVELCSTTTGVTISGSPITSSGSINLNISTASTSCTGLLTSTDWNTFNNKQNSLGFTPVPDTRQLTINGTAYDLTADRTWSVGTVTSIATSAPLTGGTITNTGTLGITQAGASTDGYLSSTDWNTFNGKQASGNYITALTGDATASGPGSVALTLATVNATTGTFGGSTQVPVITVNNKGLVTCVTTGTISGSLEFIGDVTGVGSTGTCTTLTLATVNTDVYTSETLLNIAVNGKGLITSANPTTAGDICSTLGYTPENVANKSTCTSLGSSNTLYPTQLAVKTYVDSATAGGIILQGDWNANTNTPDITGTTTTGFAWRVSVAGTTNLGGITDWQVGDLAVKSATGWVKIDNSDGVTSVFGRFGAVVATTGDYLTCQVTECGNLYYTDARVRAAVGHTAPLTYNSTTGVFGISQSNTTTDGYLSAVDWNTFNDKQPLIACGTTSQYYRGDKTFQTLDTSVVTEGTNLYFTNSRARAAICAGSGISYNSTSGQITNSCPDQIVSLMGGGTTSITGTYPNFTITSNDTYLGTVTCVAVSGTNITVTGSPITSSGTIGLSIGSFDICNALGFSPYNSTNPAGYTTCTGTVTSVASCTSTTGVSLSGSPISMSGTLGIDISTASATCTGLLNSFDWNTFNNKTSCTGTVSCVAASTFTTGVSISGSPITSSGTLDINISTASLFCTGLLTSTDWNTFNSKSSCLGTVTCVGLISATPGVTIGNSPITSSGDITLNIATASAVCTGLLTSADWNTFNNHTGCTGTVTFVNATGTNISVTGGPITTSGTLNISLSGADVCSALGYTPYNATNPNGYTTCTGTVTSVGIVATNINVCASPVTTSGDICLNLTGANVCAALGYSPVIGSLTSGYIPKATGSASLSDGLLYDNGSAVLLGTVTSGSGKFIVYSANPDNHYQAVGSAPSFRFADTIIAPTYTSIIGLATATNNFLIGAAAGDMVLANNTSSIGNFLFGTGATERMRINANGNVSIGGTGNTYKLEVTGTTNITGQLTLGSTITNGTYTYTLPGATGTLALTSAIPANPVGGTGTTNYLPKFTGTSTIGNSNLINDASGNLGLGVTPSAFGYAGNMQIVDGGILGSIGTYIHNVTNAYYDTSWKYRQSASSARYSQEVGSHVWYNAPSGTAGNAISFTQAMTLNASGNLGLGTTTLDSAANFTTLSIGGTTGGQITFQTAGSKKGSIYNLSTALYINGDAGVSLIFNAGGSERARITSGGNVGIGTTAPNHILTANNSASGGTYLGLYQSYVDGNDWRNWTIGTNNQTFGDFAIAQSNATGGNPLSAGTIRMYISKAGNVGIGTTSPNDYSIGSTAKVLQVTGSSYGIINANAGSVYAWLIADTGAAATGTQSNHDFKIVTNNIERARITSGGNVGIGTTSTSYRLHTETTSADVFLTKNTSSTSFNRSYFYNNNNTGLQILSFGNAYAFGTEFNVGASGLTIQSNTTTAFAIGTSTATPLIFGTNATEKARITSAGNIGFGTTTPTDYTIYGYGPVIETRGGVGGVFITKNSTGTLLGSFSADSGSSLIKLKAETNHALAFFTNDLEKARITTSGNFNIKNGTITTGASFSITALNTNTVINSTPYSGLIVIRDNTNGGSAVWLADPNMGYIQISNNMPGTFSMSYGSGVTNIQKNSGSVPVNYSVGFYSNVLA